MSKEIEPRAIEAQRMLAEVYSRAISAPDGTTTNALHAMNAFRQYMRDRDPEYWDQLK